MGNGEARLPGLLCVLLLTKGVGGGRGALLQYSSLEFDQRRADAAHFLKIGNTQ